jgi:hypothetical protein
MWMLMATYRKVSLAELPWADTFAYFVVSFAQIVLLIVFTIIIGIRVASTHSELPLAAESSEPQSIFPAGRKK